MLAKLIAVGPHDDLNSAYDALVLVGNHIPQHVDGPLGDHLRRVASIDAGFNNSTQILVTDLAPASRLVVSPTGPLDRDQDDVRRIADAARAGLRQARSAGARRPALRFINTPQSGEFVHSMAVGLLGALGGLWEPLEAREHLGDDSCEPITEIGVSFSAGVDEARILHWVSAVEAGRRLARDMAGTEPERMAPIRMAELCEQAFTGVDVQVTIQDDVTAIQRDYPLMASVARASIPVPRHHPRVIRLEFEGEGPIQETLFFAGKGVSYDTGGADLKAGGHMAGMSRDKGGAAAVAGFLLTVGLLKPKGLRVVAEIGAVRNSIGAESFVTDEIITAHSGTRVRIGNTDAEGRLVMADLLSHLREEALEAVNPRLFTLATLTGHAGRAVGTYSIAMDNGPARSAGIAESLFKEGDLWGDCFALSRLRREDFEIVAPRTRADDVLSCNNLPSSGTPRGHQFPMAFLISAAGLTGHGRNAEKPLAYTHLDIGGSGVENGDWQHGAPTAAPIVALAGRWLYER
ncbi:MAG: peptidase M17 [Myxococcales bacterium]|nr:peptidase M17 [Myxococcales bacterium]